MNLTQSIYLLLQQWTRGLVSLYFKVYFFCIQALVLKKENI